MLFHRQNLVTTEGKFTFFGNIRAMAHPCLNKDILKEFWHGFTFRSSQLNITETAELIFSIGNVEPVPLDGSAYSIHITPDGVCVFGETEGELLHGFMTLLDRLKAADNTDELVIEADCCLVKDKPLIQNRITQFCVFPETEIWELQKFVRFCGALKYTHLVLEFWGMLKYDCLKELSWNHAFSKEQLTPIINEARDLGLEIIPMFNHWGHAAASRVKYGKHVVLDQNPSLQPYFTEDGWCWNIRNTRVKALLRQIRGELMELCGDGKYFHIGCDEAYNFDFTPDNMDLICDYINDIAKEMRESGRRVIVWGDMFLYQHPHYNSNNHYTCNASTPEAEKYMLEHLDKDLIIADWQYRAPEAPVETARVFTEAGFDCLLCSMGLDRTKTIQAVISTVKEQELLGYIHTTWAALSKGMPFVASAAIGGFEEIPSINKIRTEVAAFLRKVMFVQGDYHKTGWNKIQMDP